VKGVALLSGDTVRSLSCNEKYKYLGVLEKSVINPNLLTLVNIKRECDRFCLQS